MGSAPMSKCDEKRAHASHLLMDINNNASTSSSWDFDMEQQLFLEETPLQFLHPVDPSQPHIPPTSFPDAQVGIQREVEGEDEDEEETLGAMKEMLYRIAAMQPVDIDPSTIKKPKRKNVRISDDPQSIAARHRRERISERIRILQRMVPGGTKMDTASMLDEAIRYVKFLKRQVQDLQSNQQQHIAVVGGQPATMFMDWLALQPDPNGSSSSSSSATGSPPGLGFGFTGNRTSDLMF